MTFQAETHQQTSRGTTDNNTSALGIGSIQTGDGTIGYTSDQITTLGVGGLFYVTAQNDNSFGTGYSTGDILTRVGGTTAFGQPPDQIYVVAVDGSGSVTEYFFWNQNNPGVYLYTTPPTNPTSWISVTGSGTGLQVNITWTQICTNGPWKATGLSIAANGTGYDTTFPGLLLSSADGTPLEGPGTDQPITQYPSISLIATSFGGSDSVTGVDFAGSTELTLGNLPTYVTPPASPDSWSGGHGSGFSMTATYTPIGLIKPRLAQWDMEDGTKTAENAIDPPYNALDQMFFKRAVRASDNHLFAGNGYNNLYNIAPGLGVVGTYSAPWLPYLMIPGPMTWAGITAGVPSACWAMAVGQNRLFMFCDVDHSGLPWGIDMYDISGSNPAFLNNILPPDYPVFPSPGIVNPLAVDATDDSCYVLAILRGTNKIGLLKITSGATSATDVTPWSTSDYSVSNTQVINNFNACVFAIDSVNRVLIVGLLKATHTSPLWYNEYTIFAYSLPSLALLWTKTDFRLTETTGIVTWPGWPSGTFQISGPEIPLIGGNIVDGKWVTFVMSGFPVGSSSNGPASRVLTVFDTLTGATVETIDSSMITDFGAPIAVPVDAPRLAQINQGSNATISAGW